MKPPTPSPRSTIRLPSAFIWDRPGGPMSTAGPALAAIADCCRRAHQSGPRAREAALGLGACPALTRPPPFCGPPGSNANANSKVHKARNDADAIAGKGPPAVLFLSSKTDSRCAALRYAILRCLYLNFWRWMSVLHQRKRKADNQRLRPASHPTYTPRAITHSQEPMASFIDHIMLTYTPTVTYLFSSIFSPKVYSAVSISPHIIQGI
ncbi:hypothetical protein NA56DRAFT_709804 [Hyaloscypha hepaticicola]|uniref:Uncharacterized protein n=1 Tax=Hyaloscypha hepaticicola TaxID=2082293 RepID=A0A2J6PMZ3_9HELO|nr:hypothetical protein NA56DRAFT_709804 [Hyaloscypha hepaticicola]